MITCYVVNNTTKTSIYGFDLKEIVGSINIFEIISRSSLM